MNPRHPRLVWTLLLVALMVTASCGGGEKPTDTLAPTATPAATSTPRPSATPEPTPTPALEVSSLDEVRRATLRIEAQGTFVDPEFGLQMNVPGSGSGFIIDESGIAVTNNHVVTGAAFLEVWVEGESEPRNAKILGVSECSDLAVIDIDGEGFPYLSWYDGDINAGLDVYAAGFPLGDPEFTLTRGIISKERAGGETNWASVDAVVEHDATINPGNSGGPLVSADGEVVGVNYASVSENDQYFAIARNEALKIIDELRAGDDVDSIGVNGEAVNNDEGLSGIWVVSVESGSPADQAGVKGGDIIYKMEELILATDGTMADYCDILRSHDADDTLSIEVLRFDTEEMLAGQINGRELEQSFSFAQELGDEVEDTGAASYSGYTYISDDYGAIQIEVPVEWTDTEGSAWLAGEDVVGSAVSASNNLEDFWGTFATPGVFFGASSVLADAYDEESFLNELTDHSDNCTYDGRYEYEDQIYTGLYDHYTDCSDAGSQIINIVAFPEDRDLILWVQTQIVSDADLEALDHIINSFEVVGELPAGGSAPATGETGPSIPLARFEGSAFSIDYPETWVENSIDLFGMTMVIFANQELSLEDMQSLDFEGMVSEDPIALVMVVPQEMAADMGFEDIDSAIDEFDDAVTTEDAEIIEQGDTTIGGIPGRIVVAKGTDPDLGQIGIRLVAAETSDGAVIVFLGATPPQNLEQNLALFEAMHESFQFK
jgi:serine protease Do